MNPKRNQFIRIVFLVTACRIPVIIGLMHLYVHFKELMHPGLRPFLMEEVTIATQKQPLWNTWGMTSYMMGISFIIIGLLNTIVLNRIPKKGTPSPWFLTLILCYYLNVLYAGITFEQNFQTYGGILCSSLLITVLIMVTMGEPKNK